MTFMDKTEGNADSDSDQAGHGVEAGPGAGNADNRADGAAGEAAAADFGGAVGATGSGGPNPFGGAAGSTGGPTLGNLDDRDMARESTTGPGTSTSGADIGPVST